MMIVFALFSAYTVLFILGVLVALDYIGLIHLVLGFRDILAFMWLVWFVDEVQERHRPGE